jgi:hypothetical protein
LIQPSETQGAGGESNENRPCSDASNSTGVCATRFTGAKYPLTRRTTGAGAKYEVAVMPSPTHPSRFPIPIP